MLVWLVFCQILLMVSSLEDKGIVTVKSAKCQCNQDFVFPNATCFAKSFSRNISTLTYYIAFKKPLSELFYSALLQFKYGMIYRDAITYKGDDLCKQIADQSKAHPLVKQALALMKAEDPKSVHNCPYSGMNVRNYTFKTGHMPSVFPTGDYKFFGFLTDRNNASIFNISAVLSLKSSNKDTFG